MSGQDLFGDDPEIQDDQIQDDAEPGGDDQEESREPDPRVAQVLEQFGSDPQALADAYINLRGLQSRQGAELGELRTQHKALTAIVERLSNGQGGGPPRAASGAEIEEQMMQEIMERAEKGENVIPHIFKAVKQLVSAEAEQRLKPLSDSTGEMMVDSIYNEFVRSHPDAEDLFPAIREIVQRNPALLPRDKGPRAFRDGLEDAYQLAKFRVGAGKTPQRRNGFDTGRPSRQMRSDARPNQERLKQLRDAAHNSMPGDDSSWVAYLKERRRTTPPRQVTSRPE